MKLTRQARETMEKVSDAAESVPQAADLAAVVLGAVAVVSVLALVIGAVALGRTLRVAAVA